MGINQNIDESDRLDNIATQVYELSAITSDNLLGHLIGLLSVFFEKTPNIVLFEKDFVSYESIGDNPGCTVIL